MRRWLLALLALQFFCSVSAFAYTNLAAMDTPAHTAGMATEVAQAAGDAALPGTASMLDDVHALLDDIPELPECLDVVLGVTTAATPWDVPRDHPIAEWTPPALDGPQRPPRSLHALA